MLAAQVPYFAIVVGAIAIVLGLRQIAQARQEGRDLRKQHNLPPRN